MAEPKKRLGDGDGGDLGGRDPSRGLAAVGSVAGFGALFSAAACCVLPLLLAGIGVSGAGLGLFVPFRWPLVGAAALAVAAGWYFYWTRKRACAADATRSAAAPSRTTFAMLLAATALVILSALWGLLEAPILRFLGGA